MAVTEVYKKLAKMEERTEISKKLVKLDKFETIGTIEELQALKEKNEPKRANIFGDGYADGHLVYDTYECPNCGKQYELEYEEYDYCPNCGQRILIVLEEGAE